MVAGSTATATPAVAVNRAAAVTVRLFASAAERAGVRMYSLEYGGTLTVREAFLRICLRFPRLGSMDGRLLFAVNAEYAGDSTVLHGGDELCLIPPVSGGASP
ncbi:MAG: MoaD/ThiS family protein [Dehalococcoidia bacterium]